MQFLQGLLGGGQMSLMGLILFVIITWFGSEYMKLQKYRPYIIVGGAVIFFIVLIIQKLIAKKSAAAIEDRLRSQAQEQLDTARPDRKPQVQALQKQLSEAIAALKTSKMGGSALYSLPWYIIIGPPGSGKSTALQESGLNFPYMSQGRKGIRGVGGTRNCDWWFTDQGILLDTAGRYTTELEDRDEWLSFLDMLKRCRKRKPINGAIVCVSVADLVQCSEEEREGHVKNIKDRIDELTKRLEQVFPVYLVFTKCDLLNGFVDFFEDFGKSDRSQVWGFTLPYAGAKVENYQPIFEEEIRKLYAQLSAQRVQALSTERPADKKRRIFGFPIQFSMAHRKLADFVGELFRPNPFQESSQLRGIYFTSGTQEGTPIDQLVAAMGGAFGLQEDAAGLLSQAVDRKSYFINTLFSKIIFGDQNLARSSTKVARRRRFMRTALALGSVAALILFSVSMAISFFGNWRLVHNVGATAVKVKEAKSAKPEDVAGNLKALEDLRKYTDDLDRYDRVEGRPFWLGWGLYRGEHINVGRDGKTGIRKVYIDSIYNLFLKPLGDLLLQEMQKGVDNRNKTYEEYKKLYDQVQVYSMLAYHEDEKEVIGIKPEKELMTSLLTEDDRWLRSLGSGGPSLPADSKKIAMAQMAFYVDQAVAGAKWKEMTIPRIEYNAIAVSAAISELAGGIWVTELYNEILTGAGARYPKKSHVDFIKTGQDLFESEEKYHVPGVFTQHAYNQYVSGAIDEKSKFLSERLARLKRERPAKDIADDLRGKYSADYRQKWQEFLQNVNLKKFENLRDATAKLKQLTSSESPFRELFKSIWEGRRLDLLDGKPPVNDLKDDRKWLDDALKALEDLQRSLAKILETTEPGKRFVTLPEAGLKELSFFFVKAKQDIESVVKAIPDPMLQPSAVRVITRALQSTLDALLKESQVEAEALWKSTVHENFTKNLAGKYPFVTQAADEVPLRSFSEVFNPKSGTFWATVKQLQRLKDGFKFEDRSLVRLSTDYEECVKKAEQFRDALYPKESEAIELTLPAQLGPRGAVAEIWFHTSKGKSFSSMEDPDRRGTIIWTEASPRGTKVEIRHDDNQLTGLSKFVDMDWGLLRIFHEGKIAPQNEKLYACLWEFPVVVSGNQAIRKVDCWLEIKNKVNPFLPNFFSAFKCPEKLEP